MSEAVSAQGLSWEWAWKLTAWLLPAAIALGVALQRLEVVEHQVAQLDNIVESHGDLSPRVSAIERTQAELLEQQRAAAAEQKRAGENIAAICQALTKARCR